MSSIESLLDQFIAAHDRRRGLGTLICEAEQLLHELPADARPAGAELLVQLVAELDPASASFAALIAQCRVLRPSDAHRRRVSPPATPPPEDTIVRVTEEVALPQSVLAAAQDAVHDQVALDLTQDQLLELLRGSPEILADLADAGEVDTTIREDLADLLAKKLVGRAWPSFAEPKDQAEAFYAEFASAAAAAGYAAVDSEVD